VKLEYEWTCLPAHAQLRPAQRSAADQCALTGNSIPTGLFVLLPSGEKNYQTMNLQVLKNPLMSGAVQINWRDIEPEQGKPDWTQLDALFAAAASSKKWVHLIMFPGFSLRHGHSKTRRPICSRYNMVRARAPPQGSRCRGIA